MRPRWQSAAQTELAHSAVNLGHFETLGQKKRDSLGVRHSRGFARAHVVRDGPTVDKNLFQHSYDWVTMMITKASLQCGSLFGLQAFGDVDLAGSFVKRSSNRREDTSNAKIGGPNK